MIVCHTCLRVMNGEGEVSINPKPEILNPKPYMLPRTPLRDHNVGNLLSPESGWFDA